MTEAIGWLSSVILLLTIGKQVHKQWVTESAEGLSRWLFVGQVAASAGFTAYSALLRNWVFVVTNAALLLSAVVGFALYRRNVRSARRSPQKASSNARASASASSRAAPREAEPPIERSGLRSLGARRSHAGA